MKTATWIIVTFKIEYTWRARENFRKIDVSQIELCICQRIRLGVRSQLCHMPIFDQPNPREPTGFGTGGNSAGRDRRKGNIIGITERASEWQSILPFPPRKPDNLLHYVMCMKVKHDSYANQRLAKWKSNNFIHFISYLPRLLKYSSSFQRWKNFAIISSVAHVFSNTLRISLIYKPTE